MIGLQLMTFGLMIVLGLYSMCGGADVENLILKLPLEKLLLFQRMLQSGVIFIFAGIALLAAAMFQ
jgi:hypothetical protein